MSGTLYHYTDTARLPWILQDGFLRPGRNRIGGFPDPDFLWATTQAIPDRTASAEFDAMRKGLTRCVRFILSPADFERWPDATASFSAWTLEQIARLEHAARGKSSPGDWRCRAAALPRASWLGIETRRYRDNGWTPFDLSEEPVEFSQGALGVWIRGRAYVSAKTKGPDGADGYQVFLAHREAAE